MRGKHRHTHTHTNKWEHMECKVNEGPEKSCSDILGMHIFRGNEGKKEEAERKMKKRRGGFDQISRDNNLARRRPTERESLPPPGMETGK